MSKRDEEAVAVDGSLSCRQHIREYANRNMELSTGVWSIVDNNLKRAGDVSGCRHASSAIDNILSSWRIRVSFEICL